MHRYWFEFANERPFQKAFCSQHCATNAYLFLNVVCGVVQRFTSNVKVKSEK